MKTIIQTLTIIAVATWLTACSKNESSSDHNHGHDHHTHKPIHGGTAVELGEHQYQLEFVHDLPNGLMKAYVMDGHMEHFVRISVETFEITAEVAGKQETLSFRAIANNSTGEAVGNTSQFEAQADWLKSQTNFDATLKSITIKSSTFTNVAFNFPKGKNVGATK